MSHIRKRFMGVAIAVGVVLSGLLTATAQQASASPQYPYPWPDNSVVAVLFVPTDWSVSSAEVQQEAAAIRSILPEIRQFYANNNNGKTFAISDLQVVQAWSPKETYGITWTGGNIYTDGVQLGPGFEGSVVDELHRRGFPTPPAQNQSGYSTLIWAKGAGGYAGARAFSAPYVGGWGILGDWSIDSIQGQVPEGAYWWSGKRLQTGSSAHELGHTFDLPHPDAYGASYESSIMGTWWNYPTAGLNDTDRQRLRDLRPAFFTQTAAPPTPANAVAAATGSSSIRLTWTDNSTFETGFRIRNGSRSVTVPANSTSYTWSGLSSGQYMCLAVSAYNAVGASPYSPWACATTTTPPPSTPGNVRAAAISGTSVRVTWRDTSNETGYRISNGNTSVTVGANATSYTWAGLQPGQYMCFRVSAYNTGGTSAQSPWSCVTTPTVPAAPTNLRATPLSQNQIQVTWTDNSNNENGFQIYNGVGYLTVGTNSTSALYSGLSPGQYMCFSATSYNLAGSSPATPYACTTTPS